MEDRNRAFEPLLLDKIFTWIMLTMFAAVVIAFVVFGLAEIFSINRHH